MTERDLSHVINRITSEPGVYRMLDAVGTVLYVGKASNLKKRVSSYFSKQNIGVKTRSLVSQIHNIEVSVTRSETEALLLESNLIKSLRPKYNILLRDDKTYPYIQVSSEHPFPRMTAFRSKKKPQKGTYFGPYPSSTAMHETLNLIQKVFKIRNCRDSYFNNRSRPCLQYQIKRCTAPCTDYISQDDYQRSVQDAMRFLQGKCQLIIQELSQRMQEAVNRLAYEEAAILRDQIKSLRLVQEQQSVVQLRGDADVIAIEAQPGFACIQCVTIRDGQVLASRSFFPSMPADFFSEEESSQNNLYQQVLEAFIAHYYLDAPERIPALIVMDKVVDDEAAIAAMLSELRQKSCKIQTNPRGVKAGWMDFAQNNLRMAIAEHHSAMATIKTRYQSLQQLLGLSEPIQRMECFDISHTQGEETVASCVVFNQQGPDKKEYRRFNITGITGGDDYAAMQQAISRRFKRLLAEDNLPDVLIIDGGKGQVGVAQRVLDELGIDRVYLLGVAKGVDRKAGWERLVLVVTQQEITLPMDSPALHLLQHIRDEAHRFAITTHRKKRNKAGIASSLESIEGIGQKRRKALLSRFGGVRELAKAPVAEITKISGINESLAKRIYEHFHPE